MHLPVRSTRARSRPRRPDLRVHRLESREVPATISGRVFLDFDNSGTFNGPDSGIQGVTITLSGGGLTTPQTTTTDAQGNYSFGNLAVGNYTVTETQPTTGIGHDGKVTRPTAVIPPSTTPVPIGTVGVNKVTDLTLTSTTTVGGLNFAEVPQVQTGGFVFNDLNNNGVKDAGEAGIAGVKVTLTGTSIVSGPITAKTATTDVNGEYKFQNLTPGTYTITETQPTAFSDGKEQNGTPTGATVGADKFTGIDLTKAATSGGFNFGEVTTGTLSGVVFADANNDGTQAATGEPGIAGVKVVLTGQDSAGHPVSRTTTTGADGSYTFNNLAAGTYTVREIQPTTFADGTDKAGSLQGTVTNDQIAGINFTANATATGYTFAEKATADLSLVQTPVSTFVNPNGTVTITYTVKNRGSAAITAASVAINFGGLTFVSSSNTTAFNSTTKVWTVGPLAANATQTLRLTFRMPAAGGTFVTTAKATTPDTQLSTKNDASSSTITSVPPPPPTPVVSGPSFMFGGDLMSRLLAAWSNFNPLTRLWLFTRFFG
jgi:uncharacterized protein (DUF2141 family)